MVGLDKMKDYTELLERLDYLGHAESVCEDAAKAIRELELTKGQLHDIAGQYIIQITALKEQIKAFDKLCIQAIPAHSVKLITEFTRIKAMEDFD